MFRKYQTAPNGIDAIPVQKATIKRGFHICKLKRVRNKSAMTSKTTPHMKPPAVGLVYIAIPSINPAIIASCRRIVADSFSIQALRKKTVAIVKLNVTGISKSPITDHCPT